jgi:hypothetical protein
VGVNCAKDSLRQSDIDSGGLVAELTDVNVYDRPGPTAIAALAAQLLDGGRLWKGLAVVQQTFQMKQDRLSRVSQRLIQGIPLPKSSLANQALLHLRHVWNRQTQLQWDIA